MAGIRSAASGRLGSGSLLWLAARASLELRARDGRRGSPPAQRVRSRRRCAALPRSGRSPSCARRSRSVARSRRA